MNINKMKARMKDAKTRHENIYRLNQKIKNTIEMSKKNKPQKLQYKKIKELLLRIENIIMSYNDRCNNYIKFMPEEKIDDLNNTNKKKSLLRKKIVIFTSIFFVLNWAQLTNIPPDLSRNFFQQQSFFKIKKTEIINFELMPNNINSNSDTSTQRELSHEVKNMLAEIDKFKVKTNNDKFKVKTNNDKFKVKTNNDKIIEKTNNDKISEKTDNETTITTSIPDGKMTILGMDLYGVNNYEIYIAFLIFIIVIYSCLIWIRIKEYFSLILINSKTSFFLSIEKKKMVKVFKLLNEYKFESNVSFNNNIDLKNKFDSMNNFIEIDRIENNKHEIKTFLHSIEKNISSLFCLFSLILVFISIKGKITSKIIFLKSHIDIINFEYYDIINLEYYNIIKTDLANMMSFKYVYEICEFAIFIMLVIELLPIIYFIFIRLMFYYNFSKPSLRFLFLMKFFTERV